VPTPLPLQTPQENGRGFGMCLPPSTTISYKHLDRAKNASKNSHFHGVYKLPTFQSAVGCIIDYIK
jgi:hypothetical protein